MANAYRSFSTLKTPQRQPLPDQVKNEAGGYGFEISDWDRLTNFLILGSEGGTYYVKQGQLTKQNAQAVIRCIQADGLRTVRTIRDISYSGRAAKNDPALLALALAISLGNEPTRKFAADMLLQVARTGTHLLHFVAFAKAQRGFGRILKRAVADWFTKQDLEHIQYELIKYPSRDKWAMRDLLRLSHPVATSMDQAAVLRYAVHGLTIAHDKERDNAVATARMLSDSMNETGNLKLLWAAEVIKHTDPEGAATLIRRYRLPRETVPTELLTKPEVWEALVENMPITAMLRNLATMTKISVISNTSLSTDRIVERLTDPEVLQRGRVHPISILNALRVYAQGHGDKSDATWVPVTKIVDALDKAFYASFKNIQPTGKRLMIGLDVSGSMEHSDVVGLNMSCIEAESAMALVTMATEPNAMICAFDTVSKPLTISPRQRLDDVVKSVRKLVNGGTNCAVPIQLAIDKKIPVDCFVIYTDSETWAGDKHVTQVLKEYRNKVNPKAKLITAQMTSTSTSLNDPNDAGMLQFAGLDANAPSLINEFVSR